MWMNDAVATMQSRSGFLADFRHPLDPPAIPLLHGSQIEATGVDDLRHVVDDAFAGAGALHLVRVEAAEAEEQSLASRERMLLGETIEAVLIERRLQGLLGNARGSEFLQEFGNGVIQLNVSRLFGLKSTDVVAEFRREDDEAFAELVVGYELAVDEATATSLRTQVFKDEFAVGNRISLLLQKREQL